MKVPQSELTKKLRKSRSDVLSSAGHGLACLLVAATLSLQACGQVAGGVAVLRECKNFLDGLGGPPGQPMTPESCRQLQDNLNNLRSGAANDPNNPCYADCQAHPECASYGTGASSTMFAELEKFNETEPFAINPEIGSDPFRDYTPDDSESDSCQIVQRGQDREGVECLDWKKLCKTWKKKSNECAANHGIRVTLPPECQPFV